MREQLLKLAASLQMPASRDADYDYKKIAKQSPKDEKSSTQGVDKMQDTQFMRKTAEARGYRDGFFALLDHAGLNKQAQEGMWSQAMDALRGYAQENPMTAMGGSALAGAGLTGAGLYGAHRLGLLGGQSPDGGLVQPPEEVMQSYPDLSMYGIQDPGMDPSMMMDPAMAQYYQMQGAY